MLGVGGLDITLSTTYLLALGFWLLGRVEPRVSIRIQEYARVLGEKVLGLQLLFLDFQNIKPCVIEEVGLAEVRE